MNIFKKLYRAINGFPVSLGYGEELKKYIRFAITSFFFICLFICEGNMPVREFHQISFMVFMIALFALFLRNLWISAFLLWASFLFCFFKFWGLTYLTNIFLGCMLYYFTKIAFKDRDIDFVLNGIMWLVIINLAYIIPQILGYDWIWFSATIGSKGVFKMGNEGIKGFMGMESALGCLLAIAMPVFVSRSRLKYRWLLGGLLFIPILLSKSSMCIGAAGIGLLFVMWHRVKRKIMIPVIIFLLIGGLLYVVFIDRPDVKNRMNVWHTTMILSKTHPVTGWGLDSFRTSPPWKPFKLCEITQDRGGNLPSTPMPLHHLGVWDNAHNLYVQLFFEFGIVGLFILLGYWRFLINRFNSSVKTDNTLALFGALLVVFVLSLVHFPLFLIRLAVIIVPLAALCEVETDETGITY